MLKRERDVDRTMTTLVKREDDGDRCRTPRRCALKDAKSGSEGRGGEKEESESPKA